MHGFHNFIWNVRCHSITYFWFSFALAICPNICANVLGMTPLVCGEAGFPDLSRNTKEMKDNQIVIWPIEVPKITWCMFCQCLFAHMPGSFHCNPQLPCQQSVEQCPRTNQSVVERKRRFHLIHDFNYLIDLIIWTSYWLTMKC